MTSRFNLFDFFAYLLPGAYLLIMIVVPVVLALDVVCPEIPTALVVAVSAVGILAAYGVGHLIQRVAQSALPSKILVEPSLEFDHPSNVLLRSENKYMDEQTRLLIIKSIHRELDINLSSSESKSFDSAFKLCRSTVLSSGRSSYIEQFHGLYTMMRGLAFACYMSSTLVFGIVLGAIWAWALREIEWKCGLLRLTQFDVWPALAVACCMLYACRSQMINVMKRRGLEGTDKMGARSLIVHIYTVVQRKIWVMTIAIGVLPGVSLGSRGSLDYVEVAWFFPAAVTLVLAGLVFREAHIEFASAFARSVYVDFLALTKGKPSQHRLKPRR